MIRKGDLIDVDVTKTALGGQGIGEVDGFNGASLEEVQNSAPSDSSSSEFSTSSSSAARPPQVGRSSTERSSLHSLKVFVTRGIPGQKVRVRIVKHKRQYAEGKTLEVLTRSPLEVEAKCPYFAGSSNINEKAKSCGGCLWQNLSYEKQLEMKEGQVRETLEHVGKFKVNGASLGSDKKSATTASPSDFSSAPSSVTRPPAVGRSTADRSALHSDVEIRPILGSPDQFYYRNKVELSFGQDLETGDVDFGFRQLGMFREVVPIESCVIFDRDAPAVLDVIRRYVRMHNWEVFDFDHRPNGFWQYLILRRGVNTGEFMVHFVSRPGHEIDKQVVAELKEVLGDRLQSVLHTVNFGKAISYSGHENKKTEVLFGRDYILEQVGDLQFTISPFSFFQTNTVASKILYDVIKEGAGLTGKEKVLDAYCGTGTIGQYLAKEAREVVGVEILEEAVKDAEANARHNRLPNCSYVTGDISKLLHFNRGKFLNIDTIIMDPPRAGIAKKGLMSILKLGAPRIVYVSCNPATLARDLMEITGKRYKISWVQPVDLFPHTGHVESVVVLDRVEYK